MVDGRITFVGGVNMARAYENPRTNGTPPDTDKAF
jgi:phosphatidylserine/phosphatidylglycerophosphate/cardiolipin synthase-like enzyme